MSRFGRESLFILMGAHKGGDMCPLSNHNGPSISLPLQRRFWTDHINTVENFQKGAQSVAAPRSIGMGEV